MGRRKRRRVDPTHEWEQLELLCAWDEQRDYERIRPLVLFGEPVPDRAVETGTSERALYRRVASFREEGMESLFGSPKAKRRVLPPAIRRKIVDLKAEHPPLNLEEIANVCGVLFGRRPDGQTAKAETWEDLVEEHDLWLERHNTQRHQAHENRRDGRRRSPSEILGAVRVVRHHPTDLSRAFFSTRFTRVLDTSGYARIKHWRVYAEEGLACCEVALWLGDDGLVVEHAGRTLSRYDVSLSRDAAKLEEVTNPRLYTTGYGRGLPQLRLFGLEEALGEGGWLKMLRLRGYAPRGRRRPVALQQALFPYLEAL